MRAIWSCADELARRRRGDARGAVLVGVNCRDLDDPEVVQERFAALAPLLPPGVARGGRERRRDAPPMRGACAVWATGWR